MDIIKIYGYFVFRTFIFFKIERYIYSICLRQIMAYNSKEKKIDLEGVVSLGFSTNERFSEDQLEGLRVYNHPIINCVNSSEIDWFGEDYSSSLLATKNNNKY